MVDFMDAQDRDLLAVAASQMASTLAVTMRLPSGLKAAETDRSMRGNQAPDMPGTASRRALRPPSPCSRGVPDADIGP